MRYPSSEGKVSVKFRLSLGWVSVGFRLGFGFHQPFFHLFFPLSPSPTPPQSETFLQLLQLKSQRRDSVCRKKCGKIPSKSKLFGISEQLNCHQSSILKTRSECVCNLIFQTTNRHYIYAIVTMKSVSGCPRFLLLF